MADNLWLLNDTMTLSGNGSATPTAADFTGDDVEVAGMIYAANGRSRIDANTTFLPGSNLHVEDSASLTLHNFTTYSGGAVFGQGELIQDGDADVTADTTVDTASYSIAPGTTTVRSGATLSINPPLAPVDRMFEIEDDGTLTMAGGSQWILSAGEVALLGNGSRLSGVPLQLLGGDLSGIGVVATDVFARLGTVSPGLSAGLLSVGTFTAGQDATLHVELGGAGDGEYDVLRVADSALVGGTLQIDLIDGFTPAAGDVLSVVVAQDLSGQFHAVTGDVFGPGGEFLAVIYWPDHVSLYCPLLGDANLDGVVSGADFTIWGDNFGSGSVWTEGDFTGDGQVTGADFTVWGDHFGQSVSLEGTSTAVPEPAAWSLLLVGIVGATGLLRRQRSR